MPVWFSGLSVQSLILAQVMISPFMGSSPMSVSVLTAQSLLGILSLPLSLPLPCSLSLSLSLKINKLKNKIKFGHLGSSGGPWVVQSVKHLTLGFSSDRDLTVRGFEPGIRLCTGSAVPAWNPLSLSLSAPPLLTLSVSFSKINK